MNALSVIDKTMEYLEYLKVHILHVEQAFVYVSDKCNKFDVFTNTSQYDKLSMEVLNHDMSKLSVDEFVQYRKYFFPTDTENRKDLELLFNNSQIHHKSNNSHHWENQTLSFNKNDDEQKIHCFHMVIDWVAMSYKFGGTAEQYYNENKSKIDIPAYAMDYLDKILQRL